MTASIHKGQQLRNPSEPAWGTIMVSDVHETDLPSFAGRTIPAFAWVVWEDTGERTAMTSWTSSETGRTPVSERIRKRTLFRLNWAAIMTVIVASAVAFVLGMACQWQVIQLAEKNSFSEVPWCTDAIAEGGGICHGEPVPPCPTEDSADCYWDASRGNGMGRSFVDIGGVVYYQEVGP